MDDHATRRPPALDARAKWLHELRNAMNTIGVTVSLGRRMLERGDGESAAQVLAHTEEAWADCRALLAIAPEMMSRGPAGDDVAQ